MNYFKIYSHLKSIKKIKVKIYFKGNNDKVNLISDGDILSAEEDISYLEEDATVLEEVIN